MNDCIGSIPETRSDARPGFALIATLVMMVLLLVLALGLLSLSSVTLRSSGQESARTRAEANARMALIIAIGQLQETAGVDQRVTARADILERDGNDVSESKRHITGVWSTEDWDPLQPDKKKFVDWLVSRAANTDPTEDYVNADISATDGTVELVGRGSVANDDAVVRGEKVDIVRGTKLEGRYGYAVLDDGIKASLRDAGTAPDGGFEKLARLSGTSRTALEVTGIPEFDAAPTNGKLLQAVSMKSADLVFSSPDKDVSRRAFHDVAAGNYTLLTDVRNGGMRRDLSSAFELPLAEFNALEEFHNGKEKNNTDFYPKLSSNYAQAEFYDADSSPDLGYLFQIPVGTNNRLRGPTWDLLRNHYRQYKRDRENSGWARDTGSYNDEVLAARGELPLSYATGFSQTQGAFSWRADAGALYGKASKGGFAYLVKLAAPFGTAVSLNNISKAQAARVAPMVVRFSLVLGLTNRLVNGQESVVVSFDPYMTILNPYNVPIEFDSFGYFTSKMNPVRITLKFTNEAGNADTASVRLSNNVWNTGSLAMRMPTDKGRYRLEPGEVKTISPQRLDPAKEEQVIEFAGVNLINGVFDYSEISGIVALPDKTVKPKSGSQIKVEIRGRTGGDTELDHMVFSLLMPTDHNGAKRDLDSHLPPKNNTFADTDIMDDQFVTKLGFSTQERGSDPFLVSKDVGASQIPRAGTAGLFIAVVDCRLKHAGEDVSSFVGFNPRGMAFDPRDYDGADRIAPNWDLKIREISDISDLNLATDAEGHGLWGGGISFANGSSKVILYEVPRLPMTSLAQFQHADVSVTGTGGSRQLGNSFPHSGIADLKRIETTRSLQNLHTAVGPQNLYDSAWAGNDAIWDRYFFSGMNYGSEEMAGGSAPHYATLGDAIDGLLAGDESPFFNPNMALLPIRVGSDIASRKSELEDYAKIARQVAIRDGFNVNSTSVEAWKAVLAGSRELEIPQAEDNGSVDFVNSSEANPMGMFAVTPKSNNDVWSESRSLTDDEIGKLAEGIVTQVKLRGPFMGLGDFVNRRLTANVMDGYSAGALGAVQMAIEDAGLNSAVSSGHQVSFGRVENKTFNIGGNQFTRSTMAGAPGYLMQADVLSMIGGRLSARSDTFTIRAYGEALDAGGKVVARAWCEAVVQRGSEWMDGADKDKAATKLASSYPAGNDGLPVLKQWEKNDTLSPVNQRFGRQFKMVSFKWLKPDEV